MLNRTKEKPLINFNYINIASEYFIKLWMDEMKNAPCIPFQDSIFSTITPVRRLYKRRNVKRRLLYKY